MSQETFEGDTGRTFQRCFNTFEEHFKCLWSVGRVTKEFTELLKNKRWDSTKIALKRAPVDFSGVSIDLWKFRRHLKVFQVSFRGFYANFRRYQEISSNF